MNRRPLLAFYGDDFTGSTDAMEALERFGIKTVLFLQPPNEKMLNRFKHVQCIGVAGTARAKNKEGIKKELIPIFEEFKDMNPYFVHYKVCSTFDSSPEVGSIGYACDIARNYFDDGTYPLLVAAPDLGRYTVFGNHFANFQGNVYRLDEHPVMSRHPVTPMDEADLGVHLQKQTGQSIDYVSILDLESNDGPVINDKKDITVFDALEEKHMEYFANEIWENKTESSRFLVGSSGVEYALGTKWLKEGISNNIDNRYKPKAIEQMLVVSGSVSDVTKRQLDKAEKAGFHMEQLPYELLAEETIPLTYMRNIIDLLNTKKKVVLYTARGTDDSSIIDTKRFLRPKLNKEDIGTYIGRQLGKWTKYILENTSLHRLIVSGGDTSGFVTSQLGIYGLEVLESVAPGAPLCIAHSENERFDKMEIALKSGQLGGNDFFENVYKC